MTEIDAFCIDDEHAAVGQSADLQLLARPPGNRGRIVGQHLDQGLSHAAIACDEQVYDLVALAVEELMMNSPDGFRSPRRWHDHRDIPLGRTLGSGADRDAVGAKGGQHPAGRSAVPEYVVSDQADDGISCLDLQGIKFPERDLVGETGIRRFAGLLGILLRDGDAHGMHG